MGKGGLVRELLKMRGVRKWLHTSDANSGECILRCHAYVANWVSEAGEISMIVVAQC